MFAALSVIPGWHRATNNNAKLWSLPKNALSLCLGSLQIVQQSKCHCEEENGNSISWAGRGSSVQVGRTWLGMKRPLQFSSLGPLQWSYNNMILCMLIKIQNQTGHIKLLNAQSVPAMSFPKTGNHCWSDIVLYFLSNTHGISHVHENAQPCDGSLQKVNSLSSFCFLLAPIQWWGCSTACGLFKVALCNLDKNVCQLPKSPCWHLAKTNCHCCRP